MPTEHITKFWGKKCLYLNVIQQDACEENSVMRNFKIYKRLLLSRNKLGK